MLIYFREEVTSKLDGVEILTNKEVRRYLTAIEGLCDEFGNCFVIVGR